MNWPTYKTDLKPILASPNHNPKKPLIITKNKVQIKPEQTLGYSWNNKNKLIS
jgi:hypothetical protein